MRLPALALLLVLASLPLPGAQAAGWSVEATVSVTSATTADYTWKIGTTNLRLPLPDNATFTDARDADGKKVSVTTQADELTISGGRAPITLAFSLQGERDGPFTTFPAQVASAGDSPVTVRIALPSGWGLAGARDSGDREPDVLGAFHGTGPAYVQYLVHGPGVVDDGPVVGVTGHSVRRAATADVHADRVLWSLTTTYDTDVYSRSWDVHVPAGATVSAATTPFGALATQTVGDLLRITTPYPVGFGLGARSFTVNLTLPAPTPHGGTFREANLSVRAAEGDEVSIRARMADGLRYAGARAAGGDETAPLVYEADGPLTVGLAFLPPPEADHVQFEQGHFVVDAPRALEAAARTTARNASEMLPRVASFAYDPADTRPFFVAYTDADVFGWEEGFYSNGLNTITIRAKTLEGVSDATPRITPVGVLVHEATHGLIDRRLPDAPHDLSFLHEGLARLAETRLERAFPASQIVACPVPTSCTRHSARPGAEDVQEFHKESRLFDVAWRASAAPDSERGFLYDYSGLVMNAFDARAPAGALGNALATIARTDFEGEPSADARRILDVFLANAPGTAAPAFLYPGREAAALTADQFRHCMGDLVAPPYPWEDTRAPPGGCPATGYGARDAALPPPPGAALTPTPPPTPTPAPTGSAVALLAVDPPALPFGDSRAVSLEVRLRNRLTERAIDVELRTEPPGIVTLQPATLRLEPGETMSATLRASLSATAPALGDEVVTLRVSSGDAPAEFALLRASWTGADDGLGSQPGAIRQPPAQEAPGTQPPSAVPGPGLLGVALVALAAALLTRRR